MPSMWVAKGHPLLTTVPVLCGPMGRDNTLRNNLEAKIVPHGIESGSSPLILQIRPRWLCALNYWQVQGQNSALQGLIGSRVGW